MKRISSPIESLIRSGSSEQPLLETDFLIVGSGYGGAVAAMRLACESTGAAAREVVVLERGKEYGLGDFPYDFEDIPSHVRVITDRESEGIDEENPGSDGSVTGGYPDALFNLHVGGKSVVTSDSGPDGPPQDGAASNNSVVDVLVGSGLGGTSLINANVAEVPADHVFRKPGWPQEFRDVKNPLAMAFENVRQQIGVTTRTSDGNEEFSKYSALRRVGRAVKGDVRPATIAVSTGLKSNGVGVQQNPCTDCGNCITGCNVGAKNTLDRNLLRLAKSRGATFHTGATVEKIEPCGDGGSRCWKIYIHPTVPPAGTAQAETYFILADNVILAAGTLGSTEILLRSEKENTLMFSPRLGERFSTNGDGIAMSYGQKTKVGAVARAAQKNVVKQVGPTITGIMQTRGLSVEEASIPAPLARIFSELVTSGAMLQRLARRRLPALLRKGAFDPVAASMEVAEHCQALLIMGDDGAKGKLSLSPNNKRLHIHFPRVNENKSLSTSHEMLKSLDRKSGLDGGQYVPNPLWKLLPSGADEVLGGTMPDSRVLTVHPLGGCAMSDTVEGGVVNHEGQVFDPMGTLHEGLYVLDGSIVPTALEVNPFLTIAALAWRNSGLILEGLGVTESGRVRVKPEYADLGKMPDRQRDRPAPTAFVIQEQLYGSMREPTPWFERNLCDRDLCRLTQEDGLVVQVSAAHENAERWLENPGATPLRATMELYINPLDADDVEKFQPVGVNKEHLQMSGAPLMTLDGHFTILAEDSFTRMRDYWGGIKAMLAYRKRRGMGTVTLWKQEDGLLRSVRKFLRRFCVFYNIGMLQSRRRRMHYVFQDHSSGVSIRGEKVMGYSNDLPGMWQGLLNLDIAVGEGDSHATHATLQVNPEYLLEPGLLEIKESANLPQSLLFAGGLGSFFARSMLVTNFWEFGGLESLDAPAKQCTAPRPLMTASGVVDPQYFPLEVPIRLDCSGKPEGAIPLQLTRYPKEGAEPILLLHGLAQGSQIYWTESTKNLATYFYDNDFDVWLLDYRLSNHILPHISDRNWSMDEIARFDIPMAIDEVCALTGKDSTSVFGHCVGACTLAMATLSDETLHTRITAAVTNAIHPWVISSPGNRFRAKFGGFYREQVAEEMLNPIPHKQESAIQNVIDRIAFGLSRLGDAEEDDHQLFGGSPLVQGICDRMSFLYGRMWNHKNLTPETHEAFSQMLGPAPVSVYQHLYHYSQTRRITDKNGENIYLDYDTIRERWKFPILFVHGEDSRVFNPHSARRSARRLSRILRPDRSVGNIAVGYKIYPGYGHMDVIFGKNAHVECFPDYVRFLKDPDSTCDPIDAADWPTPHQFKPKLGPVLRAAWIENDRIRLRFWCELRTNMVRKPTGLVVSGGRLVEECEVSVHCDEPDTRPRYRLIDVEIESDAGNIELIIGGDLSAGGKLRGARLVYDEQAWLHRLRLLTQKTRKGRMRFVVGSCRYPGSLVDNALSDKVFGAIQRHVDGADGAQILFLTGDQIYADALDQLVEVKSLKTQYDDRYQRAFDPQHSPDFARLIATVPTHFSLDDHEIADNWSGSLQPVSKSPTPQFEYALDTAARFMSSGRSQVPVLGDPLPGKVGKRRPFYYPLCHPQECDFPTFVADSRAERQLRNCNNPSRHNMMSPEQYAELTNWLKQAAEYYPLAPKFIVSGSIVAPLPHSYCEQGSTWRQQDGWAGYPGTLENLLTFIVKEKISKVVFVGGDAHLSAVSRLELQHSGQQVSVWQIVSSGLYAPMPFANGHYEDYLWDQEHTIPSHVDDSLLIRSTNTFLSDHYSQFVTIDASAQEILVGSFDQDNNRLAKHCIQLSTS